MSQDTTAAGGGYRIDGLDLDGSVTARYAFDSAYDAHRMHKALLELHPVTLLCAPAETGPAQRAEREPFYALPIEQTSQRDLLVRLERVLTWLVPESGIDYVHGAPIDAPPHTLSAPLPVHRFLAAYAVRGGSEGHYVHVDCIGADGATARVALIKTFGGAGEAWTIARICHDFLSVEPLDWRVAQLLGAGAATP